MILTCLHCGCEFDRKPSEISERNFCSRNCYNLNKKNNHIYRTSVVKACDYCGKEIRIVPSKIKSHNFCSRLCMGKHQSEHLIGESASNYKNAIKTFSCKICGTNIFSYGKTIKVYCSRKCMIKGYRRRTSVICSYCGIKFEKNNSHIKHGQIRGYKNHFCSTDCSRNYHVGENNANWIKDRSKVKSEIRCLRYSTKMKDWRESVFKRDDYTCQKCHKKGAFLNAHHIKRFADFPDLRFVISNGITLCKKCHKSILGKEDEFVEMFNEVISKH